MSGKQQAEPGRGDPARPWKIATGILTAALVFCLGVLSQTLLSGRSQTDASATSPNAATTTATPETTRQTVDPSRKAEQETEIAKLARRQENDPMAKGRGDAPVVMIEYSDYRCPFCSVFAEETLPKLQPLIDDGTLRIEFRDLAVFGDDSVAAAAAARAAGKQGLFWEFQDALYRRLPNQGHPDVKDDLVMEIATQVGVPDMAAFEADYRSEETRTAVKNETAEGRRMGIDGTPFFFIGTRAISGAQPLETFQQIIAQEKAKAS